MLSECIGYLKSEFSHGPFLLFKRNLPHHKLDIFSIPGVYGGAIILCNHVTKLESFKQKLFALPDYATSFIRKIRAGMLLFVFEREEKKLSGVFEATSDGALNILPNAFRSSRKPRPAQASMLLVLIYSQDFISLDYQVLVSLRFKLISP